MSQLNLRKLDPNSRVMRAKIRELKENANGKQVCISQMVKYQYSVLWIGNIDPDP
jgi:hypothetical protein